MNWKFYKNVFSFFNFVKNISKNYSECLENIFKNIFIILSKYIKMIKVPTTHMLD